MREGRGKMHRPRAFHQPGDAPTRNRSQIRRMIRAPWLRAAAVAPAAMLLLASAPAARAQTADSILALNLAARGGRARLESVRSERLIGRIELANGLAGADTVELERPLHVRTTLHLGARTIVQASDGRTTWTVNPLAGDTTPTVMTGGAAQNVEAGADLDGPLVDYAAKGNRVTFAGRDTADGRPAFALDVVTAAGLHDRYFIDARTHLQTKWQGRRIVNGDTLVFESYFRDYRRVDGIAIAFRIDSDTRGRPGGQHITIARAEVNVPIDAHRFRFPR